MLDELPDDTDELESLTLAQAEALAQRQENLSLNGLKSITDDAARILATHTGGTLCLDGISELSDTAADALARHEGEVYFESLRRLTSPALAAKLGSYFWFPSVQIISAPAAAALVDAIKEAGHDKPYFDLNLDALVTVDAEVARVLASHKGYLSFDGLTSLPDDTAAALAEHEGSLGLEGLTTLSASAAKALAPHRGCVMLDRLDSLSPEAARALAAINGDLHLGGLTSISDDCAVALGRHSGVLLLDGIASLTPLAAEGLAAHNGELLLRELKTLSTLAAKHLAKHKDLLSLGLASIADDTARALSKHEGGVLKLDSLTSLSDAAAQFLARFRGWTLSLDGLATLTPRAAAALARRKAKFPYIPKLCFRELKSLPPLVAAALAQFKGVLHLWGVEELTDEAAACLATFDGELCLNDLKVLSDFAAEQLARVAEIKVDVSRWPASAAARFHESRLAKDDASSKAPKRSLVPLVADNGPLDLDESAVKSTLVLRDVIAAAPSILKPIGTYKLLYAGSRPIARKDFLEDEEIPAQLRSDVQWAVGDYLESLTVPESPPFATKPVSPDDPDATWVRLRLAGCPPAVALDGVSADTLRKMYAAADHATFGDMKSMETRVDPLVRSGREIPSSGFQVSRALCEWVRCTWAAHFRPTGVRVEPYKINLYGPGDRFAMHRDTPEKDLVGTFLLALSGWGPPCSGGGLIVHDEIGAFRWDGANGWAAFVPFLPHEVEPVSSGARVTLAFKVFAAAAEADYDSETTEALLEEVADRVALCRNAKGQVGVLLKYAYSLSGTALCGADRFIYRALTRLGSVASVPVAVQIQSAAKDADTYYWQADADVYALTEGNLRRITSSSPEPPEGTLEGLCEIPFITASSGHAITKDGHDAVENVGNYAEPANVNSLYVHRALIVTTSAKMAATVIRSPNADFARTDLSERNLQLADLQGGILTGASFARANLQQAFLANSDLTGADLRWADFTGADLSHADLTSAQLFGTCFREASLHDTCLEGVQWDADTVWPEGFDPLQHGASSIQTTHDKAAGIAEGTRKPDEPTQ